MLVKLGYNDVDVKVHVLDENKYKKIAAVQMMIAQFS